MTTSIQERLAALREKAAQAQADTEQLWRMHQESEKEFHRVRDIWHKAHLLNDQLQKELAILEGVAKELQSA